MDTATLRQLVVDEEVTLTDVIDVVIEVNALIGVGLISLGDDVYQYITHNNNGYVRPVDPSLDQKEGK
jgi:hypothetical protein